MRKRNLVIALVLVANVVFFASFWFGAAATPPPPPSVAPTLPRIVGVDGVAANPQQQQQQPGTGEPASGEPANGGERGFLTLCTNMKTLPGAIGTVHTRQRCCCDCVVDIAAPKNSSSIGSIA